MRRCAAGSRSCALLLVGWPLGRALREGGRERRRRGIRASAQVGCASTQPTSRAIRRYCRRARRAAVRHRRRRGQQIGDGDRWKRPSLAASNGQEGGGDNSPGHCSTALQSALHLYSSTALYTLHPLHPPSGWLGASTLISLSCPRRRSFNHVPPEHRPPTIDQSTIVGPQRPGTPQRPAAMDAAPHGPYGRRADARPASVGRLSGLSGRCRPRCCRSGPSHAQRHPHNLRQL